MILRQIWPITYGLTLMKNTKDPRIYRTKIIWWTKSNTTQGHTENSCTIQPLTFCWTWTVYKSQGYYIKCKVIYDLFRWEKYRGLTYTTLFRATIFCDFGLFNGITMNRLTNIFFLKGIQVIMRRKVYMTLKIPPLKNLQV